MTATSTQVRRRTAARRAAVARQQKLNEDRQRRDEQELDLAAEFAVVSDECAAARAAVHTAEVALGRLVDTLIGGLRIRYERAAELLDTTEEELKRLRQVATDTATPATDTAGAPRGARRAKTRPAQRTAASPQDLPGPERDHPHDPGSAREEGDGP